MIQHFVKSLKAGENREIFVHHQVLSAKPAEYSRPNPPLSKPLGRALLASGINQLYSHQVQALELVRAGKNTVTITPTASGKTLTYNLPILEYFLKSPEGHALYLFPLKALEQDQFKQLNALAERMDSTEMFSAAIYDGDTPRWERSKIRANFPRILLTNPEMLHLSISSYHKGWERFLKNLRFIVIDELHTYKGIFGSHMAQLFRRIDRLCRYYGSSPQYIASSATIANPVELAENLTGKPFTLVEMSGAPAQKRHYIFLNPEISVYTIASRLFRSAIDLGLKTIVFTKARKITELIFQWVLEAQPELREKISAYRAGFLPEERREIEARLNRGELAGVISTSALEMGVDIGSLDLGILVGYPGTISATFQRGGRVGRKTESAVVLIAQQNALDQYFMRNPGDFFGRSFEAAVVDRENRYILKEHLVCAAAEIPITLDDEDYPLDKYKDIFQELTAEGKIVQSADGKRWFAQEKHPQNKVDLRASGALYTISDVRGKIIGTVSGGNVFSECHPGAVYMHRGRQYLVEELDFKNRNVSVKETDVSYYTSAVSQKDTEIISKRESRRLSHHTLNLGELKVTEWITGYDKRRLHSQELMGNFPLNLPEQSYQTVGLWMEIPRDAREWCDEGGLHFMGGIHGAEHALLALVPLFALCDRNDMGGISFVEHSGAGGPAIFIYDGYPGGVGLAERVYHIFEQLLEKTLKLVEDCPCDDGCPSCIHSPKCGSGNYPLDKEAVAGLLQRFCGRGDFSIERLQPPPPPKAAVQPAVKPEVQSGIVQVKAVPLRTLIFDLETRKSAEEVGGWGNIDKMRLAAAVTLELETGKYRIYYEEDAERLIDDLQAAEMVIGFNQKRFDYTVLKPYGLKNPNGIKSLDMLAEIEKTLGWRLSLGALCSATLNAEKSADGLQSLEWFKQGRLDLVTSYCIKDVELTRDLYLFGAEKGYLLYEDKRMGKARIPVGWGKTKT